MLFKYHFILEKEKRKKNSTWVLFVHKAFWKLHLTIRFWSPVDVLELSWKWDCEQQRLFPTCSNFVIQSIVGRLMADCGMKANVRIKKDILSRLPCFGLFYLFVFLVNWQAVIHLLATWGPTWNCYPLMGKKVKSRRQSELKLRWWYDILTLGSMGINTIFDSLQWPFVELQFWVSSLIFIFKFSNF